MTIDEQIAYLTKGCVDVVREAELRAKLERCQRTGHRLVVKVGFDPTAPDLHLGHSVLIRKMKHFEDLGHTVIFVIGDFTGLIGDPTGRSKTRPPLSVDQIAENAETYKSQIFKLLDPAKTVIEFNSRWLGALTSQEWIRLAACYNVAQMLERRDFKQRYEAGQPISVHEFLYPLAQAYDSVFLKADVELGGTDQLFNLNVGRDIMPAFGLEPQLVMTVPLLVGLDGVEKMSKSAGNYVGVTDAPAEMYGKLMSVSDGVMWTYYELLTDLSVSDVRARQAAVSSGELHPKRAKMDLARSVVTDFHSAAQAGAAEQEFERVHARGERPLDIPCCEVPAPPEGLSVARVLLSCGLAESASDARRKIQQGAVRVDGVLLTDPLARFPVSDPERTVQAGRQFVRVKLVERSDRSPEAGS